MHHLTATLAIDVRDMLGEGPSWDSAAGRLIWSDDVVGTIHEGRNSGEGGWRETRRWEMKRPLGAAIARTGGGLVVTGGNEIFMLDDSGAMRSFVQFDFDPTQSHFNDAKCDAQGRLWAGTSTPGLLAGRSALYRIDPDGRVATILENVTTSNGPDWSPDGRTMYYTDSPSHSVEAFDFDAQHGTVSHRRHIVTIDQREGAPDGFTVDREGCLWVAVVGAAGEVRRYAPDGTLLARVSTTTPLVTSCAFGGADGGDLFITTAAFRIPDVIQPVIGLTPDSADRATQLPGAGALFVCRPGVTGKPATPFAG